jgi:hypothetical protein
VLCVVVVVGVVLVVVVVVAAAVVAVAAAAVGVTVAVTVVVVAAAAAVAVAVAVGVLGLVALFHSLHCTVGVFWVVLLPQVCPTVAFNRVGEATLLAKFNRRNKVWESFRADIEVSALACRRRERISAPPTRLAREPTRMLAVVVTACCVTRELNGCLACHPSVAMVPDPTDSVHRDGQEHAAPSE